MKRLKYVLKNTGKDLTCGLSALKVTFSLINTQDTKEETVEAALQVLIITLDQEVPILDEDESKSQLADNLFLNYLSRIHREEDFAFILKGVTRLVIIYNLFT